MPLRTPLGVIDIDLVMLWSLLIIYVLSPSVTYKSKKKLSHLELSHINC